MRIIFFDTETTGNTDSDRLCQLAVKEKGVDSPLINSVYKPPVPISIGAMAIHHITEKMVLSKPPFSTSGEYKNTKSLFESEDTICVAHNAAFDVSMSAREGIKPKNVICTYKLAKAFDPEEKFEKHSLQFLRYQFNIEIEAVAHDAWGDVVVLEKVFNYLFEEMKKDYGDEQMTLNAMLAISARPLLFSTLRFGKYKGRKIEEIAEEDPSYLRWLLDQKKQNIPGEIDWIYTLEHYLAKEK